MKHWKAPCLIALMILASAAAAAQNIRDSKGRDFWVAFPPNDHPGQSNPTLAVFLSADEATSVTIEATRHTGEKNFINRPLQAGTVVKVEFDMRDYELRGARYPSGSTGDCETAHPASVNITSDKDITG